MANQLAIAPSQLPGFPGDDPTMTFPLRLSPFEKFVLWDERPSQPMTSFIELHFASPLDSRRLQAALTVAVHRNPLLACRVVERDGDWWWDYDPLYQAELLVASTNPPLRQGWPIPIDLRRECGGRYWYGACSDQSQGEAGWRLMIQLHHACCDGVGMRRVLIDALSGYAQPLQSLLALDPSNQPELEQELEESAGEAFEEELDDAPSGIADAKQLRWEALSVEALRERFDFSGLTSTPPKRTLTTWQRIKNASYFHFRLPTALRGTATEESGLLAVDDSEPLRHASLSRQHSQQILERARQSQISINDLALTLLFQTCARWNRQLGDRNNKSHIRLLMPYDLRSRVDLRMPAANRLSFSFLGRNADQCQDFDMLLASVQAEVLAIKESRLPLDFLDALKSAARRPRAMKWVINRSRRMATVVLTYTGDISRGMQRYFPEQDGMRVVGDTHVTNIYAAPPIREHTNISLGLCVNWGQLCFSAAWNRAAMTPDQCEEFLAFYLTAWHDWLQSPEA